MCPNYLEVIFTIKLRDLNLMMNNELNIELRVKVVTYLFPFPVERLWGLRVTVIGIMESWV